MKMINIEEDAYMELVQCKQRLEFLMGCLGLEVEADGSFTKNPKRLTNLNHEYEKIDLLFAQVKAEKSKD